MGRPSEYTPEMADTICAELAEGRSLRSVCSDEGMPDRTTVFRWLREHDTFRDQYARAKEESADALVDEIIEIADDGTNDFVMGKNGPVFDAEAVARSKLRVDSRKWIASKLRPKVYGDKLEVDNKGELTINVGVKRFTPDPEPTT